MRTASGMPGGGVVRLHASPAAIAEALDHAVELEVIGSWSHVVHDLWVVADRGGRTSLYTQSEVSAFLDGLSSVRLVTRIEWSR